MLEADFADGLLYVESMAIPFIMVFQKFYFI